MNAEEFVSTKFYDFYDKIDYVSYLEEKRRLQIELLNLQHWALNNKKRIAIAFEGRDAAGKGSTIKRFAEYMMPKHLRVVELGIPTKTESKYWFRRYEQHLPEAGEIVFFDRSWYNRAMIEPTMGYCTRAQYKYFMGKVLDWEEDQISKGLILIKFYLSVAQDTQLIRFQERQVDPLKYWKYSENDHKVRQYWNVLTSYKEQMFERTSSSASPWVVVNANHKLEARLKCMLYTITHIPYRVGPPFVPLIKEDRKGSYTIDIKGVPFKRLNYQQYKLLQTLSEGFDG